MDETSLRELDDRLRDEVPGTAGWVNDPAEFADYTFDELQFDPATYLVAVDDERHQFAGLVRIWANGNRSRLGLVGVARPYRRRGLARAMLASALRPVHARGVHEVMAEVDASNTASLACSGVSARSRPFLDGAEAPALRTDLTMSSEDGHSPSSKRLSFGY
ncbi:MAG: GNAT family N-acetyltransferase [Propionibacteriaceae bacterium]|nr:GNAT family N-acetyltransferase [Propionibacteriaceae bacterium]